MDNMVDQELPEKTSNPSYNNGQSVATPPTYAPFLESGRPKPQLPSRIVLLTFASLFLIAGLTVIAIEAATVSVHSTSKSYGTGFWLGTLYLLAGLMGYLLAGQPSNALTLTCLVIDCIAVCTCFVAGVFAWVGRTWMVLVSRGVYGLETRYEQIAILVLAIIVGLILIAHLSLLLFAICTGWSIRRSSIQRLL